MRWFSIQDESLRANSKSYLHFRRSIASAVIPIISGRSIWKWWKPFLNICSSGNSWSSISNLFESLGLHLSSILLNKFFTIRSWQYRLPSTILTAPLLLSSWKVTISKSFWEDRNRWGATKLSCGLVPIIWMKLSDCKSTIGPRYSCIVMDRDIPTLQNDLTPSLTKWWNNSWI